MIRLDAHQDQRGWDVLEAARGELAFDIGANVSQAARVLARNFAVVVSLEPCAESFEILEREAPDNVVCIEAAATDHEGELVLDVTERSIQTGQLVTGQALPMWGPKVDTRTVRAVTLDGLARSFGQPDFVKIDVENHEVQVVAGGLGVFAAHPKTIIEIHSAGNEPQIRELLPHYEWEVLRHGSYVRKGGPVEANHYWMVSV